MKKEEAILALAKLGCSKKEIGDAIRIEGLRRKSIQEMDRTASIVDIVTHMEL